MTKGIIIINGHKGAIQQPVSYGQSDGGFYNIATFEGTEAEIRSLASQYGAAGAIYEVEHLHGGRAKLTAHMTWANVSQLGQEVPVDLWDLDSQEVEKDLLEADFPNSPLPALSRNDKVTVAGLINNGISWNGTDTEVELPGGGGSNETHPIEDMATAYSFYLLMKAGVRSFPVDASVIRHTAMVSNRYTTKVSFSNVHRILSNATFIANEGVPSDLLFDVPSTPAVTQFIESAGDLQYGWRKLRPNVQGIAMQRQSMVINYQFGLWAVKLYGAVL